MTRSYTVDTLARASLVVLGDVMLDHHVYGKVQRVSDEAPVPIVHVRSERFTLGGAANVAANAAALGAHVTLIGMIGDDAAGSRLVDMADAAEGRLTARISVEPGRPTTVKTRYLGGQQQIVRVDREEIAPCLQATEAALIDDLDEALRTGAKVLVVSDYGKGVLTDRMLAHAFAAARAAGVPTIVDPKRKHFADYRGASMITPNRRELSEAVRLPCETDSEAAQAADVAIGQTGAAILLTRSEKGMSLFRPDAAPVHLPAEAREVFDVSGAGDTVVATIAAALAARMPVERAMRAANAAAGIVVAKLGTAVVTREELASALAGDDDRHALAQMLAGSSVTPLSSALDKRAEWRARGLSVGFTNGCFDLVHPGHISLIAQAAAACDRLIVALNADESVTRLKGPSRPVQTLEARARVIGAIRGVELVVSFAEDTPAEIIEHLQPDVLVKGADYQEHEVVGGDMVKARGGRVLLASLEAGQSTSTLVHRASAAEKR